MVIVPPDRTEGRDPGGFAAPERALFRYDLGPGRPDYRGDPIAIERRYDAQLQAEEPEAVDQYSKRRDVNHRLLAYRKLARVAWAAFGLPSFREDRPDGLAVGEALVLLGRFQDYRDELTARWRREAEILVLFGPQPGRERSYERECGLWFNRERARGFAALAAWRGALAARGVVRVDFNIVDALTHDLDAAHALDDLFEQERQASIAEAQKRTPGA